ncbi:cellulose synthase complex periplasmic endoglucanase BcsZ [Aeromonas taiwanensis]|uniref:cellulose synthase complex periplasmic endoglucanase BcsZ n=1 Tax=Aeromonas taiwanensis TaxID=633417 RepID=UPI0005C197FC|nr:cellulose synthase complex periplasmic endoglucanase BcsZ [Aeromonas taiwanensis]
MTQMKNVCGVLLLWALCSLPALAACQWPEWDHFREHYISEEGRVIDPADGRRITTSEGQSYGLFFALVNDDRETFSRLLDWTERQLARGDLTGFLPSWLWGEREDGSWGVLDENSAADSDLWIAYNLLEAGRLWDNHSYSAIGTLLLRRIAREEVATLPGLGPVLLPGAKGYEGEGRWTLNPSYLPPQLLARFASLKGPWAEMRTLLPRLLRESAPRGFSPDWVDWQAGEGWQTTAGKGPQGSYDAIRVYLWLGMLSDKDPAKGALVAHFAPMQARIAELGAVPERVDSQTGLSQGQGPSGFSAALLPLSQGQPTLETLREQVKRQGVRRDAYYGSVLTLFGAGWDQGRYRFAEDGTLQPRWSESCQTD